MFGYDINNTKGKIADAGADQNTPILSIYLKSLLPVFYVNSTEAYLLLFTFAPNDCTNCASTLVLLMLYEKSTAVKYVMML